MSDSTEPAPGLLHAGSEFDGERLDLALVALLPGTSRTRIQELVRDGGVLVDGEAVLRPSFALEAPCELRVQTVARSRERRGAPEGAEFSVVHEDEHLAVIHKPAGMVAHPSSVVRGSTVSELASARWGEKLPSPQGEDRPGIVHRLDSDTSGLMVIAKSEAAATALLTAFRERRVEKSYLALVFGEPRFDTDWIEAPIGRSRERSDRMSVRPEGEGMEAQTFYETVERLDGFGFVRCHPKTGRTHQIRVHMASIEHPLIGDRVYRGRRGLKLTLPRGLPKPERHALHAAGLAFDHPVSGERLSFEAPLEADMQRLLEALRKRAADRE